MKKYLVECPGFYSDMDTITSVVEADDELSAILKSKELSNVLGDEIYDEDGEFIEEKLPKSVEEAELLAEKHDRRIKVRGL